MSENRNGIVLSGFTGLAKGDGTGNGDLPGRQIFTKRRKYALGDQMRRAVVSIPSDIAEGQQRQTIKEYKHFLYIAKGSCAELTTQLFICKNLLLLNEQELQKAFSLTDEVSKMPAALTTKLSSES